MGGAKIFAPKEAMFFYLKNFIDNVKREYKDLYFSNKDSIPPEAVIKNKSNQNILNYLTQINGSKFRSSDNTHSGRKVTS